MASKYWLKLFHETIYDPKIMMRSPGARLRWYECLCLAGDFDRDGELPPIENMIYVFRISKDQLMGELQELQSSGLFTLDNGTYFITNWHNRQKAMAGSERTSRFRETERKREYYEPVTEEKRTCNEPVTNCYTDIDKEEIKIKDTEKSNHRFVGEFLRISEIPGISSEYQGKRLCEFRDKFSEEKLLEFADWCNGKIFTIEDALKSAKTALPNWKSTNGISKKTGKTVADLIPQQTEEEIQLLRQQLQEEKRARENASV